MIQEWNTAIENFIALATKHNVKMLMVGGAAVNFHREESGDEEKFRKDLADYTCP